MRNRILLIGPALAVLLVVIALVVPWRGTKSAGTRASSAPSPPPASAAPVIGSEGIGDPYFPLAGNGGYDVTAYDIQIRYDPPSDRIEGHTTITARATESLTRFDLDLRLPALAATVNDQPAQVHQIGGELQVTPATPVPAGTPMTVHVDYAGVPSTIPEGPDEPSPWVRTADGAVAVGEPQIAPWWYPSNDHPSDKAKFTITAIVPAGLQVISNGALLGGPEPASPGMEQWRWQESEPMATYLAFVAIGHYDIVRRDTRYGLYLAAYDRTLSPELANAARASVERTPEILDFLSGIFGPYPFHQLGGVVPDAPLHFALENQTRPVYGEGFSARVRMSLLWCTNWLTSGSAIACRCGTGVTYGSTKASPPTPNGSTPNAPVVRAPSRSPRVTTPPTPPTTTSGGSRRGHPARRPYSTDRCIPAVGWRCRRSGWRSGTRTSSPRCAPGPPIGPAGTDRCKTSSPPSSASPGRTSTT